MSIQRAIYLKVRVALLKRNFRVPFLLFTTHFVFSIETQILVSNANKNCGIFEKKNRFLKKMLLTFA